MTMHNFNPIILFYSRLCSHKYLFFFIIEINSIKQVVVDIRKNNIFFPRSFDQMLNCDVYILREWCTQTKRQNLGRSYTNMGVGMGVDTV